MTMETTLVARWKWPVPHLRRLREARYLSQAELARRSGIGRDTINRLEKGDREAEPPTIERLAAALGVGMADLIGSSGEA
jgi:transcriptional regulator with XRE-family HTH domain